MAIKRFVEAAGRKGQSGYTGPDRITGTNKVITYTSNSRVYSSESSLEKITASNYLNIKNNMGCEGEYYAKTKAGFSYS
jgi:hypothetical protein